MIAHLDDDFIQSIIKNFGSDLKSLNLSKNGLQSINGNEITSDMNPLSALDSLKEIDLSDNHM
jgi:Leucine-rich repeat (LRR) protein